MKILRYDQSNFTLALDGALAVNSLFNPQIEERVRAVIHAVATRGDAALLELTEQFDKVKLSVADLRTTPPRTTATAGLRQAIAIANRNIAEFSKRGLPKPWMRRNAQGARVGEKFDPIRRVGVYIPGGTAPLASTALMTITLAKVAGCKEIVACTPSTNPDLLYAVGVGWLGGHVLKGQGQALAVGGATIAIHDFAKVELIAAMPSLPLGYVSYGPVVSGVPANLQATRASTYRPVGRMGKYLRGGAPGRGVGQYMSGLGDTEFANGIPTG